MVPGCICIYVIAILAHINLATALLCLVSLTRNFLPIMRLPLTLFSAAIFSAVANGYPNPGVVTGKHCDIQSAPMAR